MPSRPRPSPAHVGLSAWICAAVAVSACGGGAATASAQTSTALSPVTNQTNITSVSSGITASCNSTDIGGWTTPVPSAANTGVPLIDVAQPGSRLYYISAATGSDSTGAIYFWDGANIIDANGRTTGVDGTAYGTDPMHPSAAVKAFRRWAYVGPRRDAVSDIGSPGVVGSPTAAFRAGYPDWWLFSRGETFDLSADLLSFEQETNPAATSVDSSLAVPGGRSVNERQIVGAYGDICLPRPRFVHPQNGFVSSYSASYAPALKNVAYLSLHFDGHDRAPGQPVVGIQLLGQTSASTDILFEDVWLDAAMGLIGGDNAAQITFRRALVTDNFATDGSHVQGIYYEGDRTGVLRIEESLLLRNGFSHGDPKTQVWPPTGSQIWDSYNRNLYINGETDPTQSGLFDSVSMIGASGDQFRTGGRVERNFFYQGYVGMGAHGGYADAEGATGTLLDNVLQRFVASGTDDDRGQPGWGFVLGGGASAVEVSRNIVTGAQHAADFYGIELEPLFQDCNVAFKYPTRSNHIHDNVFDTARASAAVAGSDGVTASQSCYNWVFPGIRDNSVVDNVLVNSNMRASEYVPVGTAMGTTADTALVGNRVFADRASAATALGWTGADRTLKTYLQAHGVTVTSADGFPEYFAHATQQRRGQWAADWTAKELVNYIRTGFAISPLATQ